MNLMASLPELTNELRIVLLSSSDTEEALHKFQLKLDSYQSTDIDIAGDLEIAFRTIVDEIHHDSGQSDSFKNVSSINLI